MTVFKQLASDRIAIAGQWDVPKGRIWIPPTGRPYWAHTSPSATPMTDEELREYGFNPEDYRQDK